jgi:hypothetical protein
VAAGGATARRIPVGAAAFLDSFQSELRISLELLENSVFAFASDAALLYRRAPHS